MGGGVDNASSGSCKWNAISRMSTNLYGSNDNFHLKNSHVLPALMRRFHEAKKITEERRISMEEWSLQDIFNGNLFQHQVFFPLWEFLHIDNLADVVVFLLEEYYDLGHMNVGSGKEASIKELAELVKEVVVFEGDLIWDKSKHDGTPRKLMDNSSKLAELGWNL